MDQLDDLEEKYIKEYADLGYQLRNTTSGRQSTGKTDINERKASKGYRDGLEQGYQNCKKEVVEMCKYLFFMANEDFSINDRKCKEFEQWLKED